MDASLPSLPIDAAALHQLHLDSMGGDGVTMEPAMKLALEASFGSVPGWRKSFVAMSQALGSGAGWGLLAFRPLEGSLVNQRAADFASARVGGLPLLALKLSGPAGGGDDVAQPGRYVDACLSRIDWARVYGRYRQAVQAASEPWGVSPDALGEARVLDVRRAGVHEQARTTIPGAHWRDPASVGVWSAELPAGSTLVVYCVHGHEVSRTTALRLRAAGHDARYLRGGLAGWAAAGRPLADKPGGATA